MFRYEFAAKTGLGHSTVVTVEASSISEARERVERELLSTSLISEIGSLRCIIDTKPQEFLAW